MSVTAGPLPQRPGFSIDRLTSTSTMADDDVGAQTRYVDHATSTMLTQKEAGSDTTCAGSLEARTASRSLPPQQRRAAHGGPVVLQVRRRDQQPTQQHQNGDGKPPIPRSSVAGKLFVRRPSCHPLAPSAPHHNRIQNCLPLAPARPSQPPPRDAIANAQPARSPHRRNNRSPPRPAQLRVRSHQPRGGRHAAALRNPLDKRRGRAQVGVWEPPGGHDAGGRVVDAGAQPSEADPPAARRPAQQGPAPNSTRATLSTPAAWAGTVARGRGGVGVGVSLFDTPQDDDDAEFSGSDEEERAEWERRRKANAKK